jgi:hypothetical protein
LKVDFVAKRTSDDEKTGNTVGQLKSIIEHQKDSMRKLKREMCSSEQKHHQVERALMDSFYKLLS